MILGGLYDRKTYIGRSTVREDDRINKRISADLILIYLECLKMNRWQ